MALANSFNDKKLRACSKRRHNGPFQLDLETKILKRLLTVDNKKNAHTHKIAKLPFNYQKAKS